MKEVAVEFKNVVKYYPLYHSFIGIKNFLFNLPKAIRDFKHNRFCALKDLSFRISKGETIGIIGNNGAGKSTILGLIAKVIIPSSGEVVVNGRVVGLLELSAGFHPDLTGYENIILNATLLGLTRKKILEKVDQIISFSELGEFIYQPIRTYSSGMLARLGFSVAISIEADILLIDEVLAVGDVEFQKKCYQKIEEIKSSNKTIIFVSHDLEAVAKLCDRVMLIHNGKIVKIGDQYDVLQFYKNKFS
ncbi:MAG: ABC transporter ATP-binding protein [Endomicrobia bacterium]|nr:ABC transporter ATP-binding protein [Endomicrobiia bacterium]